MMDKRKQHPIDDDNPIEADPLGEAIQEMNAAMLEELQGEEEPTECRITIAGTPYVIDLKALQEEMGDYPMSSGLMPPEQWYTEYEQEPLPDGFPFIPRSPGPMDVAGPALNPLGGPCWMCQYWLPDVDAGTAAPTEKGPREAAPVFMWGHCTSFGMETSGSRWNADGCFRAKPLEDESERSEPE